MDEFRATEEYRHGASNVNNNIGTGVSTTESNHRCSLSIHSAQALLSCGSVWNCPGFRSMPTALVIQSWFVLVHLSNLSFLMLPYVEIGPRRHDADGCMQSIVFKKMILILLLRLTRTACASSCVLSHARRAPGQASPKPSKNLSYSNVNGRLSLVDPSELASPAGTQQVNVISQQHLGSHQSTLLKFRRHTTPDVDRKRPRG